MNFGTSGLAALGFLALSALPGVAQDAGWDFEAAGYLWLPESRSGVSTPWGEANTVLSASDALDALDFGAMMVLNARKGDWALVGDLFYLDLTLESAMPLGILYSAAETRVRLSALSGYGLYTLHQSDRYQIEAGAGLRLMASDIDLRLRGAAAADHRSSISDTWVDPVLALRATAQLNESMAGVLWLDAGGFDIGALSERTWQISAMVNWQIDEKWTLGAGYRTLFVDRDSDGVPYHMRMSGPVLGVSVRF